VRNGKWEAGRENREIDTKAQAFIPELRFGILSPSSPSTFNLSLLTSLF
jgi:hypothetical protein